MPRLRRFRLVAFVLVVAVQLPAVGWLCRHFASPLPLALAVLLSWPYLRKLESPWSPTPASPSTYLALGWWCACLAFDLLMPMALLLHGSRWAGAAWVVSSVIALLVGADAVSGRVRLRRRVVRVEGLPPALDGYRIGHLSDVHCGPHTPARRVARWVRRLNAQQLDLVAVTGDLITHGEEYVGPVSQALGGLEARDGVFACMGNHDYFTDGERFVRELRGAGLKVLRNEGVVLERSGAPLYLAGADDTWTDRDDVAAALAARPRGAPAVLLAHDPDLFPEAAARGVDLTLSGHTHGGQLGVPGVGRLSLARLVTPFAAGLYRRGRSWLYVSRGAGTTGPPVRLGAPPELAVITLRRA
jgi:predicted MPP superfamily phosphohydrolase